MYNWYLMYNDDLSEPDSMTGEIRLPVILRYLFFYKKFTVYNTFIVYNNIHFYYNLILI